MNTRRIAAALRELADAVEAEEDAAERQPVRPVRSPPATTGIQIDDVTRQRARRLLRRSVAP